MIEDQQPVKERKKEKDTIKEKEEEEMLED
jgi:hypothetical protein